MKYSLKLRIGDKKEKKEKERDKERDREKDKGPASDQQPQQAQQQQAQTQQQLFQLQQLQRPRTPERGLAYAPNSPWAAEEREGKSPEAAVLASSSGGGEFRAAQSQGVGVEHPSRLSTEERDQKPAHPDVAVLAADSEQNSENGSRRSSVDMFPDYQKPDSSSSQPSTTGQNTDSATPPRGTSSPLHPTLASSTDPNEQPKTVPDMAVRSRLAAHGSESDLRGRVSSEREYGTLGPLKPSRLGHASGPMAPVEHMRSAYSASRRPLEPCEIEGDIDSEEEEDEDARMRRRFSISTPSEWVAPLSRQSMLARNKTSSRGVSFSYNDFGPFDDPNRLGSMSDAMAARLNRKLPESLSSTRIERLLRARQRRSSGQLSESNESRINSPMPSMIRREGSMTAPVAPLVASMSSSKLEHSSSYRNMSMNVNHVPVSPPDSLGFESREASYESISESAAAATPGAPQRLLIVANRLPVRATTTKDGGWSLELSSGGLVSALLGVKQNYETCWVGWPGLYLHSEEQQEALREALEAKGCVPVFLTEDIMDSYYNGYCNNVLWPLLHYIGLPQEDRLSATVSMHVQYAAYREANRMFAEVVWKRYREGDVVWVHDYHLMMLPSFLKKKSPRMKVGWFLHTPFPSSEVFRTLPLREEILQCVIAADLCGFHTYDYARHFVSACSRILGLEGTYEGVEDHGRLTRVAAFPIGIDPERFIAALESPVVKTHIAELRARFSGRKVMLGVDRLDMIKGIPQKLVAYEKFLEDNPKWRDKVLLVQIAVPSRTDVPEYQRLTSQVHEIVGRINGRFGTLTTVPIHHLDRSLAFHELCALYAITDVALVTSLRDGMNLVSYEFVACQNLNKGVLVLSEFAGAAQSLGAGALLVNPWNVIDVCSAIEDALSMSEEDRIERHRHNFMHVTTHTAQSWADTFVSELNDTVVEAELRTLRVPPLLQETSAARRFHDASSRLLILGYNSTLTAHSEAHRRRGPDQIKEMKLKLHPAMVPVLKTLCCDEKTTIIIMSGSERAVLDEAFSEFDLWLAAENGIFLRHTKGEWMTTMPEHLNLDWFESVQLVFDYFCERTPRSYVEVRETSLVWNYKYADVEFGRVQARDMLQHLWTGPISNAAVDVIQGGKSVEVRPVGISKGVAMERILGEIAHQKPITNPFDFVFVVGHFLPKDEDVYTFFEPQLVDDSGGSGSGQRVSEKERRGNVSERHSKHVASAAVAAAGTPSAASEKIQTGRFVCPDPDRPGSSGGKNSVAASGRGWHGKRGGGLKHVSSAQSLQFGGNSGEIMIRQYQEDVPTSGRSSGEYCPIVDVHEESFFSCAVGRKRSCARYALQSSDDVVRLLETFSRQYVKRPIFQTGPWIMGVL